MGILDRLVAAALPMTPRSIVRIVAKRYIAGETIDEAVARVGQLNELGVLGTIDALGEFVKDRAMARAETERCIAVIDRIRAVRVGSGISVKLTSIGLDIDVGLCRDHLREILAHAASRDVFVRIDMENTPYTDVTLSLAREMWEQFPMSVGVVLQAYLHRTLADCQDIGPTGMSVRLCKGIYVESESISYKNRDEIRESYLNSLETLLDYGTFVGIATHDDYLLDRAAVMIADLQTPSTAYEYQMLLGVRGTRRQQLVADGHQMRVYVPFGRDWYGYSIRRLKENPAVAGHVFKAMFTGE